MSTPVQKVSLGVAAVSALLGVLGLAVGSYGMYTGFVFGVFRVNLLSNILHLGIGVWGFVTARTPPSAEKYAQQAGVAYAALSLIGFFAPTGLGQIPIGGHSIWLHGVMGLLLLYFGFGKALSGDSLRLE